MSSVTAKIAEYERLKAAGLLRLPENPRAVVRFVKRRAKKTK